MNRMKLTLAALAGTALLAACNQSPEEAIEDEREQQLESQEDMLEEQADTADAMGNEMREEQLDAQADQMGEAADEVDGANMVEEEATAPQ